MRTLKTPDVTKAQMIALATLVIGVLSSLGIPLSEANTNRVFTAFVAIPTVLMISDAVIRFGRALMQGKKIAAGEFTREELGLPPED